MTLTELYRRSALALMDAAFAHEDGSESAISGNPIFEFIWTTKACQFTYLDWDDVKF